MLSQPWPTLTGEPWCWNTSPELGRARTFSATVGSGTPPPIKAAVQAIEKYLAVGGTEHAPRAMPVKQTELPHQPSALEASLKAMAKAVTQQMLLLQRVLEKLSRRRPSSRRVASSAEVLICRGTVPKATSNRPPPTQKRRETWEVRRRRKLPCGRVKHF